MSKALSRTTVDLLKARERILRGWCQGVLRTSDGRVCLIGALIAAGDVNLDNNIRAAAGCVVVPRGPSHVEALMAWNDARGRTQQEVADLLYKAAMNEIGDAA